MGFSPMPERGAPAASVAAPQGVGSTLLPSGQLGRPEASSPAADATANEASKQFMAQIRRLHALIDDLARMNPEGADLARQMKDLSTQWMVKVVSLARGREEAKPNLPG